MVSERGGVWVSDQYIDPCLGAGKDLDVAAVMVVDVDGHLLEDANRVECEVQLKRPHATVLPAHPLVACKK